MRRLPKGTESKRLDKYSPLLYMVKIELTSAGCALCLPQENAVPHQNLPSSLIIKIITTYLINRYNKSIILFIWKSLPLLEKRQKAGKLCKEFKLLKVMTLKKNTHKPFLHDKQPHWGPSWPDGQVQESITGIYRWRGLNVASRKTCCNNPLIGFPPRGFGQSVTALWPSEF